MLKGKQKQPNMPQSYPSRTRGPNPADQKCHALHEDGSECRAALIQARHTLCPSHHEEYRKLYRSYKDKEEYYNNVKTCEVGDDLKKIKIKLVAGKETLELRNTVNHRVFSLSNDNRGHIRWILKIKSELHSLEQKLVDLEAQGSESSPSPAQNDGDEETLVFRSRLDPTVPMSALEHLAPDEPVVVMKRVTNKMRTATVEKLYSIAPSLSDASSFVHNDESHAARELDLRDTIIRFVFREILLYKADADVLVRATYTQSIDKFLRESHIDDLQYYVRFFEVFQEGRLDTLHLLRDAVCDYIIDPQPSSTTILGAKVNTDDSLRRMSTRGWDILWTNFSDIVDWWNLESFAIQFGDLVTVKTLSMMRRYGPSESSDRNVPTWYVPDEDISQECALAMMQGFVAVTKSLCESIGPSTSTEYGIAKERQARSYLVGRMGKNDEFAQQLIRELSERVAGLQVLVYDREKRDVPGRLVSPLLADQNPWIARSRSASKREVLGSQLWVVEWSIGNVLDDIESINSLMGDDMTKDYYEFIIIDRAPGRQFDLLDVVADALFKLRGDPPYFQVFRQAIQKYIPAEEQAAYFEDVANVQTNELTPGFPQYVGNRIRCWDIPNTVRHILRTLLQDKCRTINQYESRIISRVSADLESHGIITKILEYEPPDVSPVIMPGIDGLDDVYFPYDLGLIKEQAEIECIVGFDPLKNNLFEFSAAYKRAHPNALFAKGRVNIPYCAWPSPVPTGLGFSHLNFRTPEGRMYRWEKLPFDMPMSPYVWQVFADLRINTQLSFVRIVQSTFVICADGRDSALANLRALLKIGEKHGLTFSVPPPSLWTSDIRSFGLESLWEGTRFFLQT